MLLEVCIESVDDAVTAVEAGADRLELNAALRLGGVTPSLGTLLEVRRQLGSQFPVIVMVRPREGDFCYSEREFDTMRRDIDLFLQHGASGIALGVLTAENRVDQIRCRHLVEPIRACPTASEGAVFHRAFDLVATPLAAIHELVELGFARIMTSGQRATAAEGAAEIARYVAYAAERIEILPAAGIRPENVEALIRRTRCTQVHGSLREPVCNTAVLSSNVQLASDHSNEIHPRTVTSARLVRAMLERLGRGRAGDSGTGDP